MPEMDIIKERLDNLITSINRQAIEYERRLELLNHEAQRIKHAQAVSVTAEKFDNYMLTQQRALDIALKAVNEKLTDLSNRMLTMEADWTGFKNDQIKDAAAKSKRSDHITAFLVGAMGIFVAIVIVLVNLWLK